MAESWAPRQRMVYSAAQLLRERGVAGTGVRDVVTLADAPRGSFQHYFPGGKEQLLAEALAWAGSYAADWATRYLDEARTPTPAGLFAHLAAQWRREFTRRGFDRGCPIMAAAADCAAEGGALADASRVAYDGWQAAVAHALNSMGIDRASSRRLATLMVSTLEGAIMVARLHRSTQPLRVVVAELAPFLDAVVASHPGTTDGSR